MFDITVVAVSISTHDKFSNGHKANGDAFVIGIS
jgi:hypothetical protein